VTYLIETKCSTSVTIIPNHIKSLQVTTLSNRKGHHIFKKDIHGVIVNTPKESSEDTGYPFALYVQIS
jgi:hypothetical protein